MTRNQREEARRILRWFVTRLAALGGPRNGLIDAARRKYGHGQWHRWYKANRRFQALTGRSLRRYKVR